ncbi:hypothetical protein ACHAWU_002879 [Discostella pseudostelligera]|uniref:Uncharacterized protein n=1 Tax=Discostella pseudostelligera TaxID=259834 RepID=A0ABD3LZ39_9STRA
MRSADAELITFCSLPSAIAMTIIGVPADRQPTQLRPTQWFLEGRLHSALLVHDVTSAQLSDTNATKQCICGYDR